MTSWSAIAYEDDIQGGKEVIQSVLDQHPLIVRDDDHVNFVAEDELAASTVNLKVYFWLDTTDFRASALQSRGEVIRDNQERHRQQRLQPARRHHGDQALRQRTRHTRAGRIRRYTQIGSGEPTPRR